jgi:LmbE family N-acetylglucosaminyl deacetylase
MAEALKLMCVLAHPDDESLGTGGTLAKYAAEGIETYLVTATRGERGRYLDGKDHPGLEAMGRIRETELRAAARELGIRDLWFLDYVDGDLDRADPGEAVGRIVNHLRRVRPHVVITFGPEGGYGHPDHIAICQFTTAAAVDAADPTNGSGNGEDPSEPHRVSKLYYMAWSEEKWAAYQAAFKKLTQTVDGIERQATPWSDWVITTHIDTERHWPTAWRAVTCHETQIAIYSRLKDLPTEHHKGLWGSQEFYRVFSLVNGGRQRETDLFEGLR